MDIVQHRVKSVLKISIITIILMLFINASGSCQYKKSSNLTHEQYELLRDVFKRKTDLYYQTTTLKGWINLITKDWLAHEVVGCYMPEDGERAEIIEVLTGTAFQSKLNQYKVNLEKSFKLDQRKLNSEFIRIVKKDKNGRVTRISAPFIFDDNALLYYQSINSESIYYLKKDADGKWQIACNFIIYAIFN